MPSGVPGNVRQSSSILTYLKEQTYFIGLSPNETFNDKRTSAYAFNYDAMKDMGIILEKDHSEHTPKEDAKPIHSKLEQSDEELFKL